MNDTELKAVLDATRTIAVIGANDRPGRPVDRVGRYLLHAGYRVIPVHPKRTEVWGLPVVQRLDLIDELVDLITVFRAPEHCLVHAEEALLLSPPPRLFWMQLGIENAEAAHLLAEHGIPVVENACLMVEHARVFT